MQDGERFESVWAVQGLDRSELTGRHWKKEDALEPGCPEHERWAVQAQSRLSRSAPWVPTEQRTRRECPS